MNLNSLCYSCFAEKPIADRPCPVCGYVYNPDEVKRNCLMPGAMLKKRYLVGKALGVGGFGITYKCYDTQVGGICAMKEYFPNSYANRPHGTTGVIVDSENADRYAHVMKSFVEEGRMLSDMDHPNIIKAFDSFSENNTAYYVMEYCDGIDLRTYTNSYKNKLSTEEGVQFLSQVMNGLEYIHGKDILHRDISPDNIYVTKSKHVKILDFGAARREMLQSNKALSVIVKMGYAPLEQYGGRGKQGPYTDIYALGSTFYHLFTGVIPEESTQRVAGDDLVPILKLRPDLPQNLAFCIEKAMSITTAARWQNIGEMKVWLFGGQQSVAAQQSNFQINSNRTPSGGTAVPNGGYQHVPTIVGHPQKQVINAKDLPGKPVSVKPVSQNPPVVPPVPKNPIVPPVSRRSLVATISDRCMAYIIDVLLLSVVYSIFFAIAYAWYMESGSVGGFVVCSLFYPVCLYLYNFVMELTVGATLGKIIKGLYVRGHVGSKASVDQIAIRNLFKLLGVFVFLSGSENMLLQDKYTQSVVCNKQ